MGLTTILISVTILDRFLESNGVMPTFSYPPSYYRIFLPGKEHISTLDPQPAFLRAELTSTPAGAAHAANKTTHIFIPDRQSPTDRVWPCTPTPTCHTPTSWSLPSVRSTSSTNCRINPTGLCGAAQ
jgi:hypothetical protein